MKTGDVVYRAKLRENDRGDLWVEYKESIVLSILKLGQLVLIDGDCGYKLDLNAGSSQIQVLAHVTGKHDTDCWRSSKDEAATWLLGEYGDRVISAVDVYKRLASLIQCPDNLPDGPAEEVADSIIRMGDSWKEMRAIIGHCASTEEATP